MTVKSVKVAPIPRGYRSITPHITTADVAAAVAFYRAAFEASEVSVETAAGTDVAVFAHLKIGNSNLTVGIGEAIGPGPINLHHYVENFDATWAQALAAGCHIISAPVETFWGDKLGLLIDPIGIRWSIAQRVTHVSAEERARRALAPLEAPSALEVA